MRKSILQNHLHKPQSRIEIIEEFCRDKSVLDIGCVQHDISNTDAEGWLHHHIVQVATEVLGVDYLEQAVKVLRSRGFNIICGDATKPLPIEKRFDVIVVGNLIEHLSSFEGLMLNINKLLKNDGVILISTANPFYSEQYFFSAFRNDIIVNPEHTCWLDPVTLNQLANRFGLDTVDVRWISEKWRLASGVIFHNSEHSIDIFTDKWIFHSSATFQEQCISLLCRKGYKMLTSSKKYLKNENRYGRDLGRVIYLVLKARMFGFWWKLRQTLIPIAKINEYELYMSIIKKSQA